MRWDALLEGWTARMLADATLVGLLGGDHLYPGQASRPVRVPSVEYLMVGDRESELFNQVAVQVDLWARGITLAAQIERRIRALTHADVGQDLDGERVWLRYREGRTVDYPADPGVIHRVLEFEFEAVRAQYTTT